MRTKLKPFVGKKITFSARVGRYGTRLNLNGKTVTTIAFEDVRLVKNGVVQSEILTCHIWKTLSPTIANSGISCGDLIMFDATVSVYEKQYEFDYKLDRITNIEIIKKARAITGKNQSKLIKLLPVTA
jgi:hypothetical protein